MHGQPTTCGSSASPETFPAWTSARIEFEALGISNPPSWSVPLADNANGAKVVQLTRAPLVEGLPLPSNLQVNKSRLFALSIFTLQRSKNAMFWMQEPHKATFKYLFELVAALKHTLSARVSTTPLFLHVSLISKCFWCYWLLNAGDWGWGSRVNWRRDGAKWKWQAKHWGQFEVNREDIWTSLNFRQSMLKSLPHLGILLRVMSRNDCFLFSVLGQKWLGG